MSATSLLTELGRQAQDAKYVLEHAPAEQVCGAILKIADFLEERLDVILDANRQDIALAEKNKKPAAFIDRLKLSEARVKAVASSVRDVAAQDNPLGEILEERERPNGLLIRKVRVPLGVIGMIYESRPNVTIDAAALCLKSHNCVILRGGSDSLNSNAALHECVNDALKLSDLPPHCVQFVHSADREHVGDMLAAVDYIDALIPRGGKGLTERVIAEAKMPVFAHLDGICHVYIDLSVKPEIARTVPLNAKMRRTGICGAAETLLLHQDLPHPLKKDILNILIKAGCTLRGDEIICGLDRRIEPANEEDWGTEYLESVLSVKCVADVEEAISHINNYGSHHTDSVLAEAPEVVDLFLAKVDSAIVMHNTSTQFADGGEFGMGAEIGISTGRMHARGPVGVKELTTYKYHVLGTGQIRV